MCEMKMVETVNDDGERIEEKKQPKVKDKK